jgi:hypothetical protein
MIGNGEGMIGNEEGTGGNGFVFGLFLIYLCNRTTEELVVIIGYFAGKWRYTTTFSRMFNF